MANNQTSPKITEFNSLTDLHQMKIKLTIYDVIKKNGRISPHDLANAIRHHFWRRPEYDYREITDYLTAGIWILEEVGEINRSQNKNGDWFLEVA